MKLSSLFCAATLSAGLCLSMAHASDATVATAEILATPSTTPITTSAVNMQGDAIEQFVRGDFAARRDMLNQWPATAEQLDQLVAYIDANELYSDAAGNTYLFKMKRF